MIYYAINFMCG